MHLSTICGMLVLLMATLLHAVVTSPVDESALAQRESYLAADDVFGPELKERGDREKRKGGFLEPIVEASFGVKSRIVGIIFGKINQLIDYQNRLVDQLDRKNIEQNKRVIANQNCNQVGTMRPVMSTTTEDAVEFDSRRVSLELPGELFGASFGLITDISKIVGDVILNTAERAQRFVEAAKPAIGRAFGIRPSRRRPPNSSRISSSSSSSSSSNSIRDTRSYISSDTIDTNLVDTGS